MPDRRQAAALAGAIFTPYDKSAALLLWGALGLVVVLVLETIACMAVLGQDVIDAAYGSAKTLVTVDPNDEVADGPKGLKAFLTVSMLVTLLLEASFTAGLVNRLINRRLTGLVGRRAVPRRDHVVVVGLGQVGLRLCLLLRRCGIGVVAIDHRDDGENVGLARELGFPVVIGRGADPSLLRRLSLGRACALAAVTDDDLENISIAMAAKSLNEDLRVVLRAGDGRLANETRSLFRIGVVRDVHRIAAALIAARGDGRGASSAWATTRTCCTRTAPRGGGRLGYRVSSSAIASNTWTYVSTDASSWVTDSVHSSSRPGVMKMPRFMLNSHASSAMSASWLALKVS